MDASTDILNMLLNDLGTSTTSFETFKYTGNQYLIIKFTAFH